MSDAGRPFQFVTASYLTRIDNQRATDAGELRDGLESCSDASIFYHTFHSLGRHRFLTRDFSNDFAQWALASLSRPALAERLAALDVRGYPSFSALRTDLLRVVDEFCDTQPDEAKRRAFEPFYFCSGLEITVPLGREARTLGEFRHWLEQTGRASFQFHFLTSRLRLRLQTNDFSRWFAEELGLDALARHITQIDISTTTLDGAKAMLLAFVDRELAA